MKKRKFTTLENPVLHFSSSVAKDLIVDSICAHFKKAGKGMMAWQTEMHLGMLEAMQNNKTTKELKDWLSKQLPKELHNRITGLINRFLRIQDSDIRKEAFLSEKQNFWDASRTVRSPKNSQEYYRSMVYRSSWMLIKRGTPAPLAQYANDIGECIDEINARNS